MAYGEIAEVGCSGISASRRSMMSNAGEPLQGECSGNTVLMFYPYPLGVTESIVVV